MTAWNPARELHDLLERSLAISPNISTEQAWKELFSITTLEDLLVVLRAVIELPRQVRFLVENSGRDDQEILLMGLSQIEDVLISQQLAQNWTAVASRLEALQVARSTLRHAASAIRYAKLEANLDGDEIEELKDGLKDLVRQVRESQLPTNLRELLIAQLTDVETALTRIDVLGPENASRNIDKVIGTLVRIPADETLPSEPLQSLAKWLKRASFAVSVARLVFGIKGISHGLSDALPPWLDMPELPPGNDGSS